MRRLSRRISLPAATVKWPTKVAQSDRHQDAVHTQVQHPSGFAGNVVVVVASQPEIAPLTYQVVDRSLMVQSLGFNLLSERSS